MKFNLIETKEILDLENEINMKTEQELFMRVYLKDNSPFLRIKTPTEINLLYEIWERVDKDSNEVVLVKTQKELIAKKYNMKYGTANNTINSLKKKEILISKGRATYILNPKYFFKNENT